MKHIFIVSPYGGDKDNQDLAARFCRAVLDAHLAAKEEVALFAPHLIYPWFLSDKRKVERKLGIAMAHEFLKACDEVWVLEPWRPEPAPPAWSKFLGANYRPMLPARQSILTSGMFDDIEAAKALGKRVVTFHSIDDVEVRK